jgi:hypothetical protein
MDEKKISRFKNPAREIRTTSATPEMIWTGANYPRIDPGTYSAVCTGWQGPHWLRRFGRWGIRIEFSTLSGDGPVSLFLNLGNNPQMPNPARESHYFKYWVLANGELPRRGQSMSPDVFRGELIFDIRVEDAVNRADKTAKRADEIYSRVIDITSVTFADQDKLAVAAHLSSNHLSANQSTNPSSNHESFNHESNNQVITQSRNQPIKEASDAPKTEIGPLRSTQRVTASPVPGDGSTQAQPQGRRSRPPLRQKGRATAREEDSEGFE